MKDNFSTKSLDYARFRPTYPAALFDFLKNLTGTAMTAWDCGTGNGQVACELARFIERVEGTDISSEQMKNACTAPNIYYSQQPAEKTNFQGSYFDLITVAQAIHWFQFEEFYKEVNRTLKPAGIIAVIGYSLFKSNKETDELIKHFYEDLIGPHWDPERKYLDDDYKTIPFPFEEIAVPQFKMTATWSYGHLLGYLKTWSAVKHFQKKNDFNPVDKISDELQKAFGDAGEIHFPLLLRVGRKL